MNVAIVGLQWGDEGKGKVVDLFAEYFDIVARYQGGHNAGHTVYRDDQKCVVHHIPAGIFHEKTQVCLGNGMVIDIDQLLDEIDDLARWNIPCKGRLWISNRAHVITPLHRAREVWEENFRADKPIGTTRRGIGPCYEDKYGRRGLVIGDLLQNRWTSICELAWKRFETLWGPHVDLKPIEEEWREFLARIPLWKERLGSMVIQTDTWLREALQRGSRVLFEGAQGTMLDIDHGTYPFVTSSHCSVGGISIGLGVSPKSIHKVIGISKAYTTRVGSGPFPTELNDEIGERIRQRGKEFGATTGRPRRCGWLDLVALKYACDLNDVDGIVLTKLDILDGFEEIRVCVAYRFMGREIRYCPVRAQDLSQVEPVYHTLPGWSGETYGITHPDKLPRRAKEYIQFIESYTGRKVICLSSGPKRNETVWFIHPNELFQTGSIH